MKVFVILSEVGRFEVAVSDTDSRNFANFLERSELVERFYIDGMIAGNQAKFFGMGGFEKWNPPSYYSQWEETVKNAKNAVKNSL
jgi:hypothetical protein